MMLELELDPIGKPEIPNFTIATSLLGTCRARAGRSELQGRSQSASGEAQSVSNFAFEAVSYTPAR